MRFLGGWLLAQRAAGGVFGRRRVEQGDADVMLIVTWKEDAEDRWIKYDSTYGTAKLLARYAAVLWESEEEARALVAIHGRCRGGILETG